MTAVGADEISIRQARQAAARRAAELGAHVSPRDVTVKLMDGEVAPGCRVFRASWRARGYEDALAGLLQDGELPDTYPAQALGKLFRRWQDPTGQLPDPAHVARVAAFLYDAGNVHTPILTEADRQQLSGQQSPRADIQLPARIDVDGRPGIAFWWAGPSGLSLVRLYLSEAGRIESEETFLEGKMEEG